LVSLKTGPKPNAQGIKVKKGLFLWTASACAIGMATEVAHGSCTDLPPGKK
jgi:hypothetical protein